MAEDEVQNSEVRDTVPKEYGDIFLAARAGDLAAVKEFAEKEKDNFDINKTASDTYPRTAFSIACENGHHEVAEYLLECGADLERDDLEKEVYVSLLHWGAQEGRTKVVELLEKKNININVRNDLGRTALWLAAQSGREEIVRILLNNPETDRNSAEEWLRRTPLSIAAEHGRVGVVEVLLGDALVNPAWRDNGQQTPLYLAAKNGHEDIVELLARATPLTMDYADFMGSTPLMVAAEKGHFEVVSWLLGQAQVNPLRRGMLDWTALIYALHAEHSRIVHLLMPRDNISLHSLVKQTRMLKFADRVSEIIPSPPPPAAGRESGEASLSLAKSLLKQGYNVNTKNDAGITPLQSAVQAERLQSVDFLIREHASMEGIAVSEWRALLAPEAKEAALLLTPVFVRAISADEVSRTAENGPSALLPDIIGTKGLVHVIHAGSGRAVANNLQGTWRNGLMGRHSQDNVPRCPAIRLLGNRCTEAAHRLSG